jgi:hypothetical protein
MPAIDVEARRRAAMRELALSRRVGDFITCDAPPSDSMMVVGGKPVTMRPPLTEAERLAEKKREDDRWFRKSLGPW